VHQQRPLSNLLSKLALAGAAATAAPDNALSQLATPPAATFAVNTRFQDVLRLTSSNDFLTASPSQQCSLIQAAHYKHTPITDPADPSRTLLLQLAAICNSSLYSKLSEQERAAVVRLAHLEVGDLQYLFTSPPLSLIGTRRLPKLHTLESLRDIQGESLLLRLAELADVPQTRLGTPGKVAARQLLSVLVHPNSLRQDGPTCLPTVIVHELVSTAPAEYVRLSAELIKHASTKTQHDLPLEVLEPWMTESRTASLGFPAGSVLPWALFQTLHSRPIVKPEAELGLEEVLPGVDIARFLGRDVDLRGHSPGTASSVGVGDIVFVLPDQTHVGHVLKVDALDKDGVTLFDPAGSRATSALISYRLGPEALKGCCERGKTTFVPMSTFDQLVHATYHFSPMAGTLPRFGIVRSPTMTHNFYDRPSVESFLDKYRTKNGGGDSRNPYDVPTLLLVGALGALATWRAFMKARDPS
jgi:hypothetical protein